jgi:hypothetical protein
VATIKINDPRTAEAYCVKNIGPRLFYIHNRIGGEGWIIKKQGMGHTLTIVDEKKAIFAILQLSDN